MLRIFSKIRAGCLESSRKPASCCRERKREWTRPRDRPIFHFQRQKGSARKRLPSIVSERSASRSKYPTPHCFPFTYALAPPRGNFLFLEVYICDILASCARGSSSPQLVYWNFSGATLASRRISFPFLFPAPRFLPQSRKGDINYDR